MFDEVKVSRTFEDIISQIEQAILDNSLKPGDKLPSERRLTEIFKVSRGTLREALRALEQKKLIKIKTGVGGGAVVLDVSSSQANESFEFLLKYQKVTIDELMEFREIVEGGFSALATSKITGEEMSELESLLVEMKGFLEGGLDNYDALFETDKRFHRILSRATRNRIFMSITITLYEHISNYFESYLVKDFKIMENTYKELSKILDAVKNRDMEAVRKHMQRHINRYCRLMRKQEKEIQKNKAGKFTAK